MIYTYELRDRVLNSSSFLSPLSEIEMSMKSHVFRDKGAGPIEKNYEIHVLAPDNFIKEIVLNTTNEFIELWRKRIQSSMGIGIEVPIKVFRKSAQKEYVLSIGSFFDRAVFQC